LIEYQGEQPIEDFHREFPALRSEFYDVDSIDLDQVLHRANVVLVHEWNDPRLVARIGQHHAATENYHLFFHDTHHRAITDPTAMQRFDLSNYDGVLAYGESLRRVYQERGWAHAAWVWHEAADARTFYPRASDDPWGDVVWIGNWGDDERAEELREFLIEPIQRLKLRASVYGVRYPQAALDELAHAGIEYRGWIPNYRVPEVFGHFRVTVHVPRRPYASQLPGIPTIRPFEAMACGIPLISAPWQDSECLFRSGRDFLTARDGNEMANLLAAVLRQSKLQESLAGFGRQTIWRRHTCRHRVDELLRIVDELNQLRKKVA
jgi:spore maturation protein CgeB